MAINMLLWKVMLPLSIITKVNAFIGPLSKHFINCRVRRSKVSYISPGIDSSRLLLLQPWSSLHSSNHDEDIKTEVEEDRGKLNPSQQPKVNEGAWLGVNPTPDIIAIMTIYFVEGALGLSRLAQTFYLKDTLHFGPAEMAAITGLFTLPWAIKPIYGFISDGFPLWGYRRRSYLVLSGLVGFVCYLCLGTDFGGTLEALPEVYQVRATIAAFILSSASIAFSDVVADGIVVQKTRESSQDTALAGSLQSLCWGSAAFGGLLSAYFSGSLLELMGAQQVFTITSILPILVSLIALAIDETPIITGARDEALVTGVRDQIRTLWSALQLPSVWRPALFLFLWQSTPTSESAFFYFLTNDLQMGPEFFGRVRLVTAAAGLFGVWAYQNSLRRVPVKDILFWTTIASTPLGLSQLLLVTHMNRALGIPDGVFVFGDDVALAILGQIAFLPTLVLAARICPPGVEAVLFATLMSIFNGASAVGTELGAVLTKVMGVTEQNFDHLAMLLVICNVSSLFPLLFFNLINDVGSQSEEDLSIEQLPQPPMIMDVESAISSSQKGIILPDKNR